MNREFPKPVELTGRDKEAYDLAHRIGRAIAAQHPGVQVSEHFRFDPTTLRITIDIKHAAGDLTLAVTLTDPAAITVAGRIVEMDAKAQAMEHYLDRWNARLTHVMRHVQVTTGDGEGRPLEAGIAAISDLMAKVKRGREKFIFIGNGGSAGISSHMAEDFTKNGGTRSVTFNDAALITCYANDYGWDMAFAKAIEHYALAGDVLIAISSSGMSRNIKNAVAAAKMKAMPVVTFSGFDHDNDLRKMGIVNFWVPSTQYGFVETAHAALLHMALDISSGWVGQP